MSRYIDADAWWKAVQSHYTDADCADEDRYELGINVGITKSRNVMMNAPSIDIVRCRECKNHKPSKIWAETKPCIVEPFPSIRCKMLNREVDPDDFCSYGERSSE